MKTWTMVIVGALVVALLATKRTRWGLAILTIVILGMLLRLNEKAFHPGMA